MGIARAGGRQSSRYWLPAPVKAIQLSGCSLTFTGTCLQRRDPDAGRYIGRGGLKFESLNVASPVLQGAIVQKALANRPPTSYFND